MTPGARTAVALALGSFVLYNANVREISSQDTVPNRVLPYEVIEYGRLDLDRLFRDWPAAAPLPFWIQHVGSHYRSSYPVVPALLAVPVYAGPVLLGAGDSWPVLNALSKLAASLFAALSVAFVYLAAQEARPPAGERRGDGPGDGGRLRVGDADVGHREPGPVGARPGAARPGGVPLGLPAARDGSMGNGPGRAGRRRHGGEPPLDRAGGRGPRGLRRPVPGSVRGFSSRECSAPSWRRWRRTTWRSSGRSREATPSFIAPTRSITGWRRPGTHRSGWGWPVSS